MGKGSERRRGALRRGFAAVALVTCIAPSSARAAGLYFSERGVRPLGRGGAFTARADDLGAMWYNPAGLFDTGNQFLLDASWLNFSTEYTRQDIIEQVDPNTGQVVARYERTYPTVEGTSAVIPIPTIGVSYKIHPEWVVAIGALAPYSAITSYPEEVDGEPSPTRYSLITLEGSALVVPGLYAAWGPIDELRVGLGFNMLVGSFVSTTMLSACVPERFFCAPEQPEFDSLTELKASPIVAPSANLGIIGIPHEMVRLGAAFQLPFWVRAPATLRSRLPTSPIFETAYLDGEKATVSFELPWSLRAGIEIQPVKGLMIELDGSIEGWDMHDQITIKPKLAFRNVVGFPDPFYLPEKHIDRYFKNSYSVRLGGEYIIDVDENWSVIPRLGVSFETSAVRPEYMSVLTVDIPKATTALGFGLGYRDWRFDVVGAYVFGPSVEVAPEDARGQILNPVEANISEEPHAVNGGSYSARAVVVGIGLKVNFDEVAPAFGVAPEQGENEAGGEKAGAKKTGAEKTGAENTDDEAEEPSDDEEGEQE